MIMLLAVFARAQDFTAGSSNSEIPVCGCDTAKDAILVKGIGSTDYQTVIIIEDGRETISKIPSYQKNTYVVVQEGPGAAYTTIAPKAFSLSPGEIQELTTFVKAPCGASGSHELRTIITSGDITKVLTQQVSIQNCQNVQVIPIKSEAQQCPCTTFTYEFDVKNNGNFMEEYSIEGEANSRYLTATATKFILQPGETKKVYLYFSPPCDIFGDQKIPVKVITKNTQLEAKFNLKAGIQKCYDYNIKFGTPYLSSINASQIEFKEATEAYDFCENTLRVIPLMIENNAGIDNQYKFTLKGANWATTDYKKIQIKAKEKAPINIILTPKTETTGEFTLYLITETGIGDMATTSTIPVKIINCYIPKINPEDVLLKVNYTESVTPITIWNTGTETAKYHVNITGPEWVSIVEETAGTGPNGTLSVHVHTTPLNTTKRGTYKAEIIISESETGAKYSKELVVKLTQPGVIAKALMWLLGNILWIILAMLLLAILAFLFGKVTKRRPTDKEQKLIKEFEKKDSKEEKKRLRWLWLLIIIAGITALIVLSYAFVWIPFMGGNATNATTAAVVKPVPAAPAMNATSFNETFAGQSVKAVGGFVWDYLWYIIIGIILLVALIIIIEIMRRKSQKPYSKKVRKSKEQQEKEKELEEIESRIAEKKAEERMLRESKKYEKIFEETGEKTEINWKPLLLILLLIAALIAIGMITYFWGIPFISGMNNSTNATTAAAVKPVPAAPAMNATLFNETFIGRSSSAVIGLFSEYLWYIIIGIIVLILLILLINFLTREVEPKAEKVKEEKVKEAAKEKAVKQENIVKKEKKARKETKNKESKGMWWKILLIFLILAIILAALYYIPQVIPTSNRTQNQTATHPGAVENNGAQADLDAVIQDSLDAIEAGRYKREPGKTIDTTDSREVFNLEAASILVKNEKQILESGIDQTNFYEAISMLIGGKSSEPSAPANVIETVNCDFNVSGDEYTINLSTLFVDPDMDSLSYTTSRAENFTVIIDGEMATIIPNKGFVGSSKIILTADDSKGGKVSSPEMTICAEEKPAGLFASMKEYLGEYGSYAVLGVVVLVIIIFILEFAVPKISGKK